MDAILHPDKPRPEGEPIIGEIARQFWKRASTYAHQATKERFLKAWRSYLDSIILQAQRRDKDRYICTIDEDTNDMFVLANDMCSYKKEILVDDADYNAVTVIMQENNTDVAGGIQWISDTHDEVADHFLKLRDDVLNKRGFPSFGEDLDRQIADYIEGLGQWIRGQDEWNFCSGRYFGEDGLEIQKTRKVFIA